MKYLPLVLGLGPDSDYAAIQKQFQAVGAAFEKCITGRKRFSKKDSGHPKPFQKFKKKFAEATFYTILLSLWLTGPSPSQVTPTIVLALARVKGYSIVPTEPWTG